MAAENIRELLHRGQLELEQSRFDVALGTLTRARELCPDDIDVLRILARAYERSRQMIPALETYDRIIELGAANAGDWLATGDALIEVDEYAQGLTAVHKSLAIESTPEAHYTLARAAFKLGDLDTACAHFQKTISETDSIRAWLSLATIIPGVPSASNETIRDVRASFARRLRRELANGLQPRRRPGPYRHSRLRIGYLSAFFNKANYMKPVWGLVNHHDRSEFEIHLYSDTPVQQGMPGYEPHPHDQVHEVAALDDRALAEKIRCDEIDVLIDLNAYSTPERLPLFLEPLAPVTAAWFNMYATSGLPGFDYIVGDREVVQPEEELFYTERVHYLPGSYLTFEVGHRAPPVAPPPCVRNECLTFGSLVTQYKITGPVLDAWAEILRRCPGSRLVLANRTYSSTCNREYVVHQFADRSVDASRLTLLGPAPHYEYLQYYDQIDVALDAFPYNGGTTTMEAIWQGVPVITFDGDRWASRTSQTLLRRTHLGNFVASSVRGYVQLACDLGRDSETPRRLSTLRLEMRHRLRSSAACDTRSLARGMENWFQAVAVGKC